MNALTEVRRRLRHAGLPILGALMAAYFGYHGLTGERSLITYWRLSQDVADAKAKLTVARSERQRIEHRVSLLRPESLDPDMLDERVRWALGYIAPKEIMVLQSAPGSRKNIAGQLAPAAIN